MPRLVLQPLLENAVLHGISRLPGGGEIEIELAQVGDELAICIRNPAPPPREGDILPTLGTVPYRQTAALPATATHNSASCSACATPMVHGSG